MTNQLGPNAPLIGIDGGRTNLNTPALVLDLDAAERNIQAMSEHCRGTNQKLRPHGKSHKSSEIARWQINAGAVGICCATIREAEVMVENGINGVLITSPVTSHAKIARLIAVNQNADELMVVVDNPETIATIASVKANQKSTKLLRLLVDFDMGLHRTGASDVDSALEVAHSIARKDGLAFRGVQAYAGHLQHIEDFDIRLKKMSVQAERLKNLVTRLGAEGLHPEIVSGGGTGTYDIDHRFDLFTELQAGSYVFTDVQYDEVALKKGLASPFQTSLTVQATIVSTAHNTHAVTDAGLKSFATDGPEPKLFNGAPSGSKYKFMGDEHGAVVYPSGTNERLKVGDAVSCIIPHCDPTVNLYDHYHCVRGDRLIEIMRIDARGNP